MDRERWGIMSIKSALPWQIKIAVKILLARLPASYRFWRWLGIFKAGDMERSEYALGVFSDHFNGVNFARKAGGFSTLEVGPGDTVSSALIARAHGASQCYLVDAGRFARADMVPYLELAEKLRSESFVVPEVASCESVDELLRMCGGCYLTEGLCSFGTIPDQSVDFIWSQAVLEHVRKEDFVGTVREMYRVLSPQGVCSHRVDLKDHLGGALNNLRFSQQTWESRFMTQSGFYTNRIRYKEMLGIFEDAGFAVEVVHVARFAKLPTPRWCLAPQFRSIPTDELLVSGFKVILRRQGASRA